MSHDWNQGVTPTKQPCRYPVVRRKYRPHCDFFNRTTPVNIHALVPSQDSYVANRYNSTECSFRMCVYTRVCRYADIDGLVQDCSTIANALEILQSCTKPRGGWGCEVSCGGHHRPRGKTTTGSALDGAVFDIAQILAYLVHDMSRSQLYLGFGHFGWLPSFFRSITFWRAWNYSLSSGWHIIAA